MKCLENSFSDFVVVVEFLIKCSEFLVKSQNQFRILGSGIHLLRIFIYDAHYLTISAGNSPILKTKFEK